MRNYKRSYRGQGGRGGSRRAQGIFCQRAPIGATPIQDFTALKIELLYCNVPLALVVYNASVDGKFQQEFQSDRGPKEISNESKCGSFCVSPNLSYSSAQGAHGNVPRAHSTRPDIPTPDEDGAFTCDICHTKVQVVYSVVLVEHGTVRNYAIASIQASTQSRLRVGVVLVSIPPRIFFAILSKLTFY